MVERRNDTDKQTLTIINVLPEQHVIAFREAAKEFDIEITVLASAGENYEELRSSQFEKESLYSSRVPKDHVQVEISSLSGNFRPFYDRAAQVLARMQASKIKKQ